VRLNLQGWRKTGYWLMSNAFLIGGALHLKGSFTEYRDGVLVLAAAVLTAHTVQEVKKSTSPGVTP
jgi:hypothetical protein